MRRAAQATASVRGGAYARAQRPTARGESAAGCPVDPPPPLPLLIHLCPPHDLLPSPAPSCPQVYHSFAFMPECQILCCNSNKDSYLYEYQGMEIQSEPLKVHGDLAPMVACELHEASATVVTAAGTDLALFDTRTGVMKRLMPAAIADDISCLHVNAAGSRLFAGTVAGHVVSVPLVSAVARRVYPAAPGEVVHIAALPVDRGNGLMTVTSGGVVTVWPDPDCVGSTKPVHRVALGYAVQSAGVSLSPAFLLVVDADGGWAALSLDGWRFTTLHRRSPAPDVPVVRLLPLAPAPAVCLAAVGGRLEVWGLSPSPFGDMVIAAWDSTPAEVPCRVFACATTGLLLSGWLMPHRGMGGRSEATQKFVYLKWTPKFGPL